MHTRKLLLVAAAVLFSPTRAPAEPIYLDSGHTQFVDFEFSVASSITLVRGQTGFLSARITNSGNAAATFKPYDTTNPIGGFGWSFSDPGLAIGVGPVNLSGAGESSSRFTFADGRVDPVPELTTLLAAQPDFSNLSGVVVPAGGSVQFTLVSMLLHNSAPSLINWDFTTSVLIAFGDPVFQRYLSSSFTVDIFAGSEASTGALQPVVLQKSDFPGHSNSIAEPSTLATFVIGLAGISFVGWRRTRNRSVEYF